MRAGAGRAVLAPGSIAQIASRNAIFALVGPGRPRSLGPCSWIRRVPARPRQSHADRL